MPVAGQFAHLLVSWALLVLGVFGDLGVSSAICFIVVFLYGEDAGF